jgi:Ni,Fe-hydrogenase III large subunit
MVESNIAADACIRKHRDELEQIHRHLQVVHSGIQLSVGALRFQNCDVDEDVACVLSYCIGERLLIQIERLGEIVADLNEARVTIHGAEDDEDCTAHQH